MEQHSYIGNVGMPMSTRMTLRLDFCDGRRLGHGKIALLEAIQRTGSISAAGRAFGMSYRRAWLLADDLNHMFSAPLIETRGGGKNGGGAVLTPYGEQVATRYREAERKAIASAADEIAWLERALGASAGSQSHPDLTVREDLEL